MRTIEVDFYTNGDSLQTGSSYTMHGSVQSSPPSSPVGSKFWAPVDFDAKVDEQNHSAFPPVREAPATEAEAPMARRTIASEPISIEDLEVALTLNYSTKEGIAMRQRCVVIFFFLSPSSSCSTF